MKVLVIGKSTRSIVCSAKRAGYTVYALDQFGDIDTRKFSDKAIVFGKESENTLYELAETFGDVDAVILGTGFEKLKFKNILANPLEIIEEVNDKFKTSKKLRSMDIPHPETVLLDRAYGLGFPMMLKPRSGSGGMLNRKVHNEEELSSLLENGGAHELIAQEFVNGVPCSVSLISTGDDSVAVAVNEQLIGLPWLTRVPFAYCGNITPFYSGYNNEMAEFAMRICREFGLKGSIGVDFILTEKGPFVIEVNARFQGSLDTVELSTGINIFDAHVKAFAGELPEPREPFRFAAKAIVFADTKVLIDRKISEKLVRCMEVGRAADVPSAGFSVQPDEPVTTLMETGDTREVVMEKINKSSRHLKKLTEA